MFATAGSTVAPGRQLALGLLAGGIPYFAPTLVAVARHRGAAPLTFSFNLLLGWTGVGWVSAWFLALADRRLHIYVTSPGTMRAVVPPEHPRASHSHPMVAIGGMATPGETAVPSRLLERFGHRMGRSGSRAPGGFRWAPRAVFPSPPPNA
jgi:Superinfection immunity protein